MAPHDSTARKLPRTAAPAAIAPHNIEAEQALLGAILVNNEAFYRVSDFLEPRHFFEPLHQKIYEVASDLSAPARSPARSRSRPSCRPTSKSAG